MPKAIAKAVFFGGALVISATAFGYSQIFTFRAPPAELAKVVQSPVQSPVGTSEQVSAFVTSTRAMAQPAVASLEDMRGTTTVKASFGVDALAATGMQPDALGTEAPVEPVRKPKARPSVGRLITDEGATTPPARPAAPRVAAVVSPKPATARTQTNRVRSAAPVINKRRYWSTGEFR